MPVPWLETVIVRAGWVGSAGGTVTVIALDGVSPTELTAATWILICVFRDKAEGSSHRIGSYNFFSAAIGASGSGPAVPYDEGILIVGIILPTDHQNGEARYQPPGDRLI